VVGEADGEVSFTEERYRRCSGGDRRHREAGRWFSSVDELEEVDIGDGGTGWPTLMNVNLGKEQKEEM
jgi:hypothetical protein